MAPTLPSSVVERVLANAEALALNLSTQTEAQVTFDLPAFFDVTSKSDRLDLTHRLTAGLDWAAISQITGYFTETQFLVVPWGVEPAEAWN